MSVLGRLVGGGSSNAAYVTARVSARKNTLLPRDTYEKLLLMEVPQISRFIGETTYATEIEQLGGTVGGIDLVERATYLHLAHQSREILGMCQGELKSHLAVYLRRWDVWNVKTVLRGKSQHVAPDQILEDIVPAGEIPLDFFSTLAHADGFDEVLKLLEPTPYDELIKKGIREGGALDLRLVEDLMDRHYFEAALRSVKGGSDAIARFRAFLRREVDTANLKTLLRLKFDGVPSSVIEESLVRAGYALEEADLRRLAAAEPFGAFVQELGSVDIAPEVKAAAEGAEAEGSLNKVLTALEKDFLKRVDSLARTYPLSILPVIGFIVRKKVEVDNIRIVARGVERQLLPDLIREMLYI